MRITPFFIWLISILFFFIASIFIQTYRYYLYVIIATHLPILAWGIKNIRTQFFGKVLFHNPNKPDHIALTFDDGPDPSLTPDILNTLKKHNMKATFFVISNRAKQYPGIVKQCLNEGHTIACHDLSHSVFSNFRTAKPLLRDLNKSRDIIQNIIGKKPLLYRPPVGLMNPHVPGVLKKLNMSCIGWSKSAGDAGNRRSSKISKINTLAGEGEVILLHDTLPNPGYKQEVLSQLDKLCISIKSKKFEPVGVEEMFDIQAYV